MRHLISRVGVLGFSVASLLASLSSYADSKAKSELDVAGRWEVTTIYSGVPVESRLVLESNGNRYTGKMRYLNFHGFLRGKEIHLTCTIGQNEPCGEIILRKEGSELLGEGFLEGLAVNLRATMPRQRSPGKSELHTFVPKSFHFQFSGEVQPALRVFPGDTVRTKTVDALGNDEKERRRALAGNPLTGPFYVEGAMPGDTLAIHFSKVVLNRDVASMPSISLNPGSLLPFWLSRNADQGSYLNPTWKIDLETHTAAPAWPSERLKSFQVKIQPMIGSVAVAPPLGQSASARDLGAFGGSMDYPGIGEGTTLYLPVFQKGALLYLGNVHALQGEGQVASAGLETSAELEFSVDVIEERTLGQPWAEDEEYIMVIGIGGSLKDALQHATTGLVSWLQERYKLSSAEVAMVLGTSVEYDIAQIVNLHVSVAAKIRKELLKQITEP